LKKGSFNSGFVLIEVVIALGLLSTALFAVFHLQAQNLDLQSEAYFETVARQLGQERLSRIAAEAPIREGASSGDFGEGFSGFSYEQTVSRVLGFDRLFKVEVLITLEAGRGRRERDLETYLYRERT